MDIVWSELGAGIPSWPHLVRIVVRLLAAMLLGAVIGYEREKTRKPAGLRTHMLVALGSALFVLAAEESGFAMQDVSRIIQGIATGIGFIGAGAILKLSDEHQIKWLTTAAGLWVTSAVGVAAGLGAVGAAALCVAFAWLVLVVCDIGEHDGPRRFRGRRHNDREKNGDAKPGAASSNSPPPP